MLYWFLVSVSTYFRTPAGTLGLFLQTVSLRVTAALAIIAGNFLVQMANLPLLPCSKTQKRVEFLPRLIFQVAKTSTPVWGIFRRVANTIYWDGFDCTGWTVPTAESDCPGGLQCTEIKDVLNFEITGIQGYSWQLHQFSVWSRFWNCYDNQVSEYMPRHVICLTLEVGWTCK